MYPWKHFGSWWISGPWSSSCGTNLKYFVCVQWFYVSNLSRSKLQRYIFSCIWQSWVYISLRLASQNLLYNLFIVGGRVGDKTDNSIAWSTVFALSVQFMAHTQLFYKVSHNRCVTLELNCSSKKWNTLLIRLMQEFKKAYEEKTFLRWMTLFFFSNIFVVWQGGYNLVWTYIC